LTLLGAMLDFAKKLGELLGRLIGRTLAFGLHEIRERPSVPCRVWGGADNREVARGGGVALGVDCRRGRRGCSSFRPNVPAWQQGIDKLEEMAADRDGGVPGMQRRSGEQESFSRTTRRPREDLGSPSGARR
jgi:hypothetical protein